MFAYSAGFLGFGSPKQASNIPMDFAGLLKLVFSSIRHTFWSPKRQLRRVLVHIPLLNSSLDFIPRVT